jgi:DNA-binding NarL/FixJ family response regulator
LWGAAKNLREVIRAPFSLVECPTYERAVSTARINLGEKAFTTVWTQGYTMSLEQVLTAPTPMMILPPTSAGSVSTPFQRKVVSYPAGLTAREVEVLHLVAAGLTDHQIAEHLVISPHTVNTHLKSIYGKLHVTSRSAATRYAIEHTLM